MQSQVKEKRCARTLREREYHGRCQRHFVEGVLESMAEYYSAELSQQISTRQAGGISFSGITLIVTGGTQMRQRIGLPAMHLLLATPLKRVSHIE